MEEHGFVLNPDKHRFGRLTDGAPITKIWVIFGAIRFSTEPILKPWDGDPVSCFPWNWNVRPFGLA